MLLRRLFASAAILLSLCHHVQPSRSPSTSVARQHNRTAASPHLRTQPATPKVQHLRSNNRTTAHSTNLSATFDPDTTPSPETDGTTVGVVNTTVATAGKMSNAEASTVDPEPNVDSSDDCEDDDSNDDCDDDDDDDDDDEMFGGVIFRFERRELKGSSSGGRGGSSSGRNKGSGGYTTTGGRSSTNSNSQDGNGGDLSTKEIFIVVGIVVGSLIGVAFCVCFAEK
uniref:Uncharacterized protein n=1 Tax=Craspedostauros australis TaxID=1486917 RepID=A0A7R9WW80_9STRA|mmetsp:Transcript_23288/g.64972  ORF Transcript_23288/g.64972 Transcript_23288/m.64972 type:complete len:226 (+) Transcript_23288:123-800(+)